MYCFFSSLIVIDTKDRINRRDGGAAGRGRRDLVSRSVLNYRWEFRLHKKLEDTQTYQVTDPRAGIASQSLHWQCQGTVRSRCTHKHGHPSQSILLEPRTVRHTGSSAGSRPWPAVSATPSSWFSTGFVFDVRWFPMACYAVLHSTKPP